jgi:hypothetical protein
MPFSSDVRSAFESCAENLGPFGDAAVICAAIPMLVILSPFVAGPVVWTRQSGLEHRLATRCRRVSWTALLKLSLGMLEIGKVIARTEVINVHQFSIM